jgi:ribosomal protein S8
MSAPTNLKEWTMPEPKKQIVSPKPKQKVFTNQVNFSDSYEQCIDTYKKKGYVVTLNYLKQLFKKNKITMTTKNQLVNVLTSIHMLNRKDRKRYFNGYVS